MTPILIMIHRGEYSQAKSYALEELKPVKFLLPPELPPWAANASFTATSVRNPAKIPDSLAGYQTIT
jgi:hypothetical protein